MQAAGRWLIAVGAVGVALVFGGLLGSVAAHGVGLWEEPVAGFLAAFAVVAAGYTAAPHRKLVFSAFVFVVGALAAWKLLEPSWYPESYHGREYQRTHLPLLLTYAGGITSLVLSSAYHRVRRRT